MREELPVSIQCSIENSFVEDKADNADLYNE